MQRPLAMSAVVALAAGLLVADSYRRAPPFPNVGPTGWIGAPASWPRLRGRVVLLDVWTFG